MKKYIIILCLLCFAIINQSHAQTTTKPIVKKQSDSEISIIGVVLSDENTMVAIDPTSFFINHYGGESWIRLSSSTTITYIDSLTQEEKSLPASRMFNDKEDMNFDTKYTLNYFYRIGSIFAVGIEFPPLPFGVDEICVKENTRRGWYWEGVKINPRILREVPRLAESKEEVMQMIAASNNLYAGLYEEMEGDGYHLALVQKEGKFYLLFIEQTDNSTWKTGEIKAELRQTVAANIFKCDWYMLDKSKNSDCIVTFETGLMTVEIGGEKTTYVKMALNENDIISPNDSNKKHWSGTGFALKDRYLVTNYHVIEGAEKIEVTGVAKDFTKSYEAKVVGTDKFNDLALLHIEDETLIDYGIPPYSVRTTMGEVGEDVFVLGYPLTSTMGDEIKLTNGIISSRSGFDGDVTQYQISAPVQPGNSGGPLFDKQGNLVGIVCSKHAGAENVGYAIKLSYLRNLVESVSDLNILPTKNTISNIELKEQVKLITPFVFMIKCSD